MRKRYLLGSGLLFLLTASVWAQPSIRIENGILNASSYRAGIARGAWFVVFGASMGPASISVYPGQLPYPVELSGTKVTFTPAAGGVAIEARIWYTSATQLAALLPSSTPAGDYNVRVTYNTVASTPTRVRVVDRNFGYATAAQSGVGPAQATNANLNSGLSLVRFTAGSISVNGQTWRHRPAYAGESLVLWGTGLGADGQSDLNGGTSGDQTQAGSVRVIVGGIEVTPTYAGRSAGSPGLDQINFIVPPNVPTGCAVTLLVRAGGRVSNPGSLAIASGGSDACQHTALTQDQLKTLDDGGTVIVGVLSAVKSEGSVRIPGLEFEFRNEAVGGEFFAYRAELVGFAHNPYSAPTGSCIVVRQRGTLDEIEPDAFSVSGAAADAGIRLLFNGPGASNRNVPNDGNFYRLTLFEAGLPPSPASGSPTLAGGTYTLSGVGGPVIGGFNAQTPFPAAFAWSNKASINTITRNQPLSIQWTGGGAETGAIVNVFGSSRSRAGGTQNEPIYEQGAFACTAPANAGRFTVPAEVTNALAPSSGDISIGDIGSLGIFATSGPNTGQFTASILAGGSAPGQFTYSWSIARTVSVQ